MALPILEQQLGLGPEQRIVYTERVEFVDAISQVMIE